MGCTKRVGGAGSGAWAILCQRSLQKMDLGDENQSPPCDSVPAEAARPLASRQDFNERSFPKLNPLSPPPCLLTMPVCSVLFPFVSPQQPCPVLRAQLGSPPWRHGPAGGGRAGFAGARAAKAPKMASLFLVSKRAKFLCASF